MGMVVDKRKTPHHLVSERDDAGFYINEYKPLEDSVWRGLISNYQDSGDVEALDTLIYHNQGLVYQVANLFKSQSSFNSSEADDIIQEGFIGLIKCVKKFDVTRDVSFSTYARYHIRGEIIRYLLRKAPLVRYGTNGKAESDSIDEVILVEDGEKGTLHDYIKIDFF